MPSNEELKRARELCAQIAAAQNRERFQDLVMELSEVLEVASIPRGSHEANRFPSHPAIAKPWFGSLPRRGKPLMQKLPKLFKIDHPINRWGIILSP